MFLPVHGLLLDDQRRIRTLPRPPLPVIVVPGGMLSARSNPPGCSSLKVHCKDKNIEEKNVAG